MRIKEIEKTVTIEFRETELTFIIGVLKESPDESARNLARALTDSLRDSN